MPEMPSNEFVELRNGAYNARGTRIGLGALVWPLRRGETAEDLMEGFPSIGPESSSGPPISINISNGRIVLH
jgi:hypothetical protein